MNMLALFLLQDVSQCVLGVSPRSVWCVIIIQSCYHDHAEKKTETMFVCCYEGWTSTPQPSLAEQEELSFLRIFTTTIVRITKGCACAAPVDPTRYSALPASLKP